MARLYVGGYYVKDIDIDWGYRHVKATGIYDARKYNKDACIVTNGPLPFAYVPSIVWGLGDHIRMNRDLDVTWYRAALTDDIVPNYVKLAEMLLS